MSYDWDALYASAQVAGASREPAEIKAELPIPFVLEQHGIDCEVGTDGKVHALCPFHDDSSPSFDVWGEHFERWGCYPCGAGGDVIDLIQRLDGLTFGPAKAEAERLIGEIAGWGGPRHGAPRQPFNLEAARELVWGAEMAPIDILADFIRSRDDAVAGLDAEWLRDRWGVGVNGSEIVIPYKDAAGELVAYKRRTVTSKPIAAAGATFIVFYGEWLDTDATRPVLLTEGESDAWVADSAVGGDVAVLGLPTGVGTQPSQFAERLKDRTVYLGFDGDTAGRKAARAWNTALLAEGCSVRVLRLPDDADLASAGNIDALLRGARAIPVPPNTLIVSPTGYARVGKDSHTPITNWTFEPSRELEAGELTAYEGLLCPTGRPAVLHTADLRSKARIVEWAAANGGNWEGSDKDAQTLLGMLQAEAPFLAPGHLTPVVGLHEGTFVYPGGRIGLDHWVFGAAVVEAIEDQVFIRPGPWTPEQVNWLRELHAPRVMDPLLAWLAAAPLRSLLREFPVLAVMGSSGSGKTTLLETTLKAFTSSLVNSNLTSTTPHGAASFAEATNGLPVWFDEFRPGARVDTLDRLRQILRDAYTSQKSSRGGTREHWAQVASQAASAPIIVSGEDAFFETSHTDRMVLLTMPRDGRNPDALQAVRTADFSGFAHAYLSFLVEGLRSGTIGASLANYEWGPAGLHPRVRLNLGVLHLGWMLLDQFTGGLPDPDFSLVISEAVEAEQRAPIEDAIRWALSEPDAAQFVAEREGFIWVKVENFVNFVSRAGFQLPGNATAVEKHLKSTYGAVKRPFSFYGGGVKVPTLSVDADSIVETE